MSHILNDNHTNGHVHHLEPLHTHERFATTLRLPHHPARTVPPVQHTVVVDRISPTLLLCSVIVGIALWAGILFTAWKVGGWLWDVARHLLNGGLVQ